MSTGCVELTVHDVELEQPTIMHRSGPQAQPKCAAPRYGMGKGVYR